MKNKNKSEPKGDPWVSHFTFKYDPVFINEKVSLKSLKIGPFTGLLNDTIGHWGLLKNITQVFGVPLKAVFFEKVESKVVIYINNIRVAEGRSTPERTSEKAIIASAKINAAQNALSLLVSRGIKLFQHDKIDRELCTHSWVKSFGPKHRFEEQVGEFVRKFITDPNKIKLVFMTDNKRIQFAEGGEQGWEVKVIMAACNKFHLRTQFKTGGVKAWKINSIRHTIRADPLTDVSEEEDSASQQVF